MNKLSKISIATGLVVTTLFSTAVSSQLPNNEIHAATKPYYHYTGTIGKHSDFILDKNFINAVKANNVTINGYHVYADTPSAEKYQKIAKQKKVYDQKINAFDKHKAIQVTFPVAKKSVSEKALVKHYGNGKVVKLKNGSRQIDYSLKGNNIRFIVKDGYVTQTQLGTHIGTN